MLELQLNLLKNFETGDKNSNPSIPLNLIGDYGGGGMMLAMGILAGVISSSKTGKGQVIDSAMIDGSLSLMSFFYSLKEMGIWNDARKSNLLNNLSITTCKQS